MLSNFIPVARAQFPNQVAPFAGTVGGSNLVGAIQNIVNVGLVLAGLAAGIFLILGGVHYITSSSNEQNQEKAKNQILYAIIGLLVIGLAAAIVNFTLRAIGGSGPAGSRPGDSGSAPGTPISIDVECSDRVDNDSDGLIDYPDDPDCQSALDDTEENTTL